MSLNNNCEPELSTSQINQSEAGPDIVQLEGNIENLAKLKIQLDSNETKGPTLDVMDKIQNMKQPVNVVAPLKIEGRGASHHQALELELAKLNEMLDKQEIINQQRISTVEDNLSMTTEEVLVLKETLKANRERERIMEQKICEQERSQEQLTVVMQEYEMLIGKLTAELEEDKKMKKTMEELMAEKDTALVHLNNVEAAFSDVHSKYEKCKKMVEEYKRNEMKLKNAIHELTESIRVKEKTLETVQTHAGLQLDAAARHYDNAKREHDQELTRLNAMLRKTELKVISLQEQLEQKSKENQELTTICDDLIAGREYSRMN